MEGRKGRRAMQLHCATLTITSFERNPALYCLINVKYLQRPNLGLDCQGDSDVAKTYKKYRFTNIS